MLTVLTVSYPLARLGPDTIGGAEAVASLIDAELARRNHASIVVAPEGSRVAGHLVATPSPAKAFTVRARRRAVEAHRDAIARALEAFPIDIVHLHGIDFLHYLPRTDVPVVVTLHLPPSWYPDPAFHTAGIHRVCVSHAQRRACPPGAAIDAVVPNGVPLELYRPAPAKHSFALALGRICREKGFDIALRAARAARVPFLLGGAVFPYPEHERHFREDIEPLLGDRQRYLGPLAGARKRGLLAAARCLVVPSLVEETSSLVAMEALASGTPVVGFRRGALPDLIEHGRTGFLVERERDLPAAIARARELDPAHCRAAAEARASASTMTARYLEIYTDLARRPRPRRRHRPALESGVLRRDQDLEALAAEWDALCDRCPWATPFQRPAWLLPWRRRFGHGAEPLAIVLYRAGRLVGLVPLELRDVGGRPELRLVGAGVSDYLDAVLEPGTDTAPIARQLEATAGEWHALELDCLRSGSPLLGLRMPAARQDTVHPAEISPVAPLPPARTPAKLAYYRRRLARAGSARPGSIVWQTERTADPAELLEALFALHAARWSARGLPGVLDHESVQHFHRDAAARLLAGGHLRLLGLRLHGELVAVLHALHDHGRVFYYLSGFSPAVAPLNPGTLLIGRAMDRAMDEGAIEFDFLRGAEPYKLQWGAVPRPAWVRRIRLAGAG